MTQHEIIVFYTVKIIIVHSDLISFLVDIKYIKR